VSSCTFLNDLDELTGAGGRDTGGFDAGLSGAGGWTPEGGTGGATAAGGVGATAGASGGPISGEDCTDGVDNDGNGLIDCADPACQPDYECVPAAPSGWQGYYQVKTGPPASPVEACPDGSMPEQYDHEPGGPVSCNPCSCGALTGAECHQTLLCWSSASCPGWPTQAFTGVNTQCQNVPGQYASCQMLDNLKLAKEGSCPASGGTVTSTPPIFAQRADACTVPATGAGCEPAHACVRRPTQTGQVCIAVTGEEACPSAWPSPIVGFDGGTDSRSCSPCTCAKPSASCGGGTVFVAYDVNGCVHEGDPAKWVGTTCVSTSTLFEGHGTGSIQLGGEGATPKGSCSPAGGSPTGSVVGTNPLTFCCRQVQ
jgi:hypothetical protein